MDVRWSDFFRFAFILSSLHLTSTFKQGTCYFPEKWEGAWFQSGVRAPVIIEGPRLSTKGRCLGSDGDKFLMVDDKRVCYRCVVIHEKHPNVLQYKETFCHGRDALPTLCSLITGDALLYSLFRENAKPVSCPFRGPFTFTYNRGHGECRSPVSNIDTCTDDSKLLLSYQACPDIYGSESTGEHVTIRSLNLSLQNIDMIEISLSSLVTSLKKLRFHWRKCTISNRSYLMEQPNVAQKRLHFLREFKANESSPFPRKPVVLDETWIFSKVEELQCLAEWKEGSVRYLVGQIHHHHVTSNEDRFRCFVYEKTSASSENADGVDYRVAQSGDATCNGLFSATEGSRTMTLRRAPPINKCRFPYWLASYNHWHTLDYSQSYSFHHRNSTLRISNSTGVEIKVLCVQVKYSVGREDSHVVLVTHLTMGCQSGFTCMSFYRRDGHVAEIQIGSQAKRLEDACSPAFFNRTNLPYVTLVTSSPERTTQPCPYVGKFDVSNLLRLEGGTEIKESRQESDDSYFDRRYYLQRFTKSLFEDNFGRRVKRVDHNNNCDSKAFTSLVIGCNKMDTMEFASECSTPDLITAYSCHGRWEENGTSYLITTPLSRTHGSKKFCFMYKEIGPNLMSFSASSNCNRLIQPGITGDLVFNVTNRGQCLDVNKSTSLTSSWTAVTICICFSWLLRSEDLFQVYR